MTSWTDLKPDMKVALRLYEFVILRKEPIWYSKLLRSFQDDLTREEVFRATEWLEVVAKQIWTESQNVGNQGTMCYHIDNSFLEFLMNQYNKVTEKPKLPVMI